MRTVVIYLCLLTKESKVSLVNIMVSGCFKRSVYPSPANVQFGNLLFSNI